MRKFIFYFDKELTQADTAPYIQVILTSKSVSDTKEEATTFSN